MFFIVVIIFLLIFISISEIVDALDVDWSALMSETKTDFKPGCARKRFTAAHVLSRIGFSQVFAGPELSDKIIKKCQEHLDKENDENEGNIFFNLSFILFLQKGRDVCFFSRKLMSSQL